MVVITPAQATLDAGTVVRRPAPTWPSAQVRVDGGASDLIPYILKGIPLHLRELRVFTDRPGFTLNPTSREPSHPQRPLWLLPGIRSAPSRMTCPPTPPPATRPPSCASLGFKPRLDLRLKGGTCRSAHPALRAVLTYPAPAMPTSAPPTSACRARPSSRRATSTIRNQARALRAGTCPKASIYGRARAFTPLLDEPLEGLFGLRANGGARQLPDLVADLRGTVDIELVGYIDAVNARIRTRFLTPRRPGEPLRAQHEGRQEGPDRQQRQPLQGQAARQRLPARPKRPPPRLQAAGAGGRKQDKAKRSSHQRRR